MNSRCRGKGRRQYIQDGRIAQENFYFFLKPDAPRLGSIVALVPKARRLALGLGLTAAARLRIGGLIPAFRNGSDPNLQILIQIFKILIQAKSLRKTELSLH